MIILCVLCALLLATVGAGCGSSLEYGQVTGTVQANHQPLANVLVTFVPEESGDVKLPRSMGATDATGHFVLQAEDQHTGAVVGRHRVVVEDLAIHAAPRLDDGTVLELPPVRFSAAFLDLLQSPLQRDVQPGEQTLDLDLSSQP